MSEFRFEKQRVAAELTLATGVAVRGSFFVGGGAKMHDGAERVGDLLNEQAAFFPFELLDGRTALYNRKHVVMVALAPGIAEAELDPGYQLATRRTVTAVLSTGTRVAGVVPVYKPTGHERLSDYARSGELFRYLVTSDRTLIVNADHIVELVETAH